MLIASPSSMSSHWQTGTNRRRNRPSAGTENRSRENSGSARAREAKKARPAQRRPQGVLLVRWTLSRVMVTTAVALESSSRRASRTAKEQPSAILTALLTEGRPNAKTENTVHPLPLLSPD